uniref:Peptidase A1 domain-containing protein n=1 Tax=Ananas comosus var. bracteatus TaxID=296719 RepID=A0A6V7P8C6_ANACO|nr:unnamed protein product [Ananas comosus var. bracteatus]
MYAVKPSEHMLPILVLLLVSLVPPAISAFDRPGRDARAQGRGGSANSISTTDVPVSPNAGEYTIGVSIGTPAQPLLLILDTGSDLVWTQCQPCLSCFDQSFPLYDPSQSSTYSRLACSSKLCQALPLSACHAQCLYLYSYGDNSTTVGTLASEAFTFGSANSVTVPNLGSAVGFSTGASSTTNPGLPASVAGPCLSSLS